MTSKYFSTRDVAQCTAPSEEDDGIIFYGDKMTKHDVGTLLYHNIMPYICIRKRTVCILNNMNINISSSLLVTRCAFYIVYNNIIYIIYFINIHT